MSGQPIKKRVAIENVAFALGIICMILAAGVVVLYFSLSLQIPLLHSQIQSLTTQNNELEEIVDLERSIIWKSSRMVTQPAGYWTHWNFSANYAGYVEVWVETSTSSNTYVRVIYSSYGVRYDSQLSVGASGKAVFPILPSSNIVIGVGNTNSVDEATETVTITYYY